MATHIRGRRRVIDLPAKARICDLVAEGASLEEAAAAVDVSLRTVQREMKGDEDFHHEVKLALRATPDPLKIMQSAARAHWRAAAWLLERSNPEQYGKRHARSASPQQLRAALGYIVEAALQTASPTQRTAVYNAVTAASERAFESVFPDIGPWGNRRRPTPPATPLFDAERLKSALNPPAEYIIHDYVDQVEGEETSTGCEGGTKPVAGRVSDPEGSHTTGVPAAERNRRQRRLPQLNSSATPSKVGERAHPTKQQASAPTFANRLPRMANGSPPAVPFVFPALSPSRQLPASMNSVAKNAFSDIIQLPATQRPVATAIAANELVAISNGGGGAVDG